MPGFDRTGPSGYGPGTGGGFGFCPPGLQTTTRYKRPWAIYGVGRGGRPWGGGRGFAWGGGRGQRSLRTGYPPINPAPFYQYNPTLEEEKQFLQEHLAEIEAEMKAIKERMVQLGSDETEKNKK